MNVLFKSVVLRTILLCTLSHAAMAHNGCVGGSITTAYGSSGSLMTPPPIALQEPLRVQRTITIPTPSAQTVYSDKDITTTSYQVVDYYF